MHYYSEVQNDAPPASPNRDSSERNNDEDTYAHLVDVERANIGYELERVSAGRASPSKDGLIRRMWLSCCRSPRVIVVLLMSTALIAVLIFVVIEIVKQQLESDRTMERF